eukprot:m.214789 g.214789  ORF g.214789 m.214789 type:complete len:55 (+) comp26195_c0_seq4:59-223(+)
MLETVFFLFFFSVLLFWCFFLFLLSVLVSSLACTLFFIVVLSIAQSFYLPCPSY